MSKIKLGCSPGSDAITGEHVRYAANTNIVLHLCQLFTVCFKNGIVPTKFKNGILIPILKKATLDPTIEKNYRPVIVSNTLSKVLEMYAVDECSDFSFNDLQFGFIKNRGTNTAISLANDVASYCNFNGSSVFLCGLDAEGAYDGIPHPVLFKKSMNVISDISWRLLYNWYSDINVKIKWKTLSNSIKVRKGTRQEGLTSSLLFNLFYKDLIDELEQKDGGICIKGVKFNVFCYADDVLLASTTTTGLQCLIDCANTYVTKCGLRFNPGKTKCTIIGKNPFVCMPTWSINGTPLEICDTINYLGAVIGDKGNDIHVNNRISACRKAFYSLQGAGLCYQGLDIDTAKYVFKATCKPALTFACESMYLSKKNRVELDRLQSKLVKCLVGLNPMYRSTPLLKALDMKNIPHTVDINTLNMFHNVMKTHSGARTFYLLMLKHNIMCPRILTNRVQAICDIMNIDFNMTYINDNSISKWNVRMSKTNSCNNNDRGLVDSIKHVLRSRCPENLHLLRLLLKAF